MGKLMIRFDAGANIGLGHFTRMNELGRYMVELGHQVMGFCRRLPGSPFSANFPVHFLSPEEDKAMEEMERWIQQERPDRFVFDLQYIPQGAVDMVKNEKVKVIVFDDYGEEWRKADLVIDAVKHWNREEVNLHNFRGVYHCGPAWCIFRPEFRLIHPVNPSKDLLITFGGSDPGGFTEKAIKALSGTDIFVTVLIGQANERKKKIMELAGKALKQFEILTDVNNTREIFLAHRLVLSAAGLTLYELSLLGIPSLTLAYDQLQLKTAKRFHEAGTTINLGYGAEYQWRQLPNQVKKILTDHDLLNKMKVMGPQTVKDGGLERIATEIMALPGRDFDGTEHLID